MFELFGAALLTMLIVVPVASLWNRHAQRGSIWEWQEPSEECERSRSSK